MARIMNKGARRGKVAKRIVKGLKKLDSPDVAILIKKPGKSRGRNR